MTRVKRERYFCDVRLLTIVVRFDSADLNSKLHRHVSKKMYINRP